MDPSHILTIVLDTLELANRTRVEEQRLTVSPDAPIFGPPSALDSLGLVALLIDMEEAFERIGQPLVLSDERALSQTRSPFRDVPSLVAYITKLTATP